MPKSSQKPTGADQPANQRGKSRFGTSGRPGRVVLPQRPPRVVDNEIVSILLGADPAALATQVEEVPSISPTESINAAPALAVVEAPPAPDTRPPEALPRAELPSVGDTETTTISAKGAAPEDVTGADAGVNTDTRVTAELGSTSLNAPPVVDYPRQARARRAPSAPMAPRADEGPTPLAAHVEISPGVVVSSFEEFAERWKHGLRKGQLKICEVLYQKTYAVGQTECVTSFSELERLSGLKMRQCFNIIAQLEALRFVERSKSADTSNKKDQGSVIRFYLYPFQ